jgi:hypothetical protein
MNAVMPGWVTDEDPAELAKRNRKKIFATARYCRYAAPSDGSVV